jgi:N-acetylmuramoyl-L-alanine amidase
VLNVCRRPIGVFLLVLLVLGALPIAGGAAAKPSRPGSGTGAACPVASGAQVVLDPGHGGSDPGAINGSLVEKDLTLEVARQARSVLQGAGYTVALTRDGDVALGNSDRGEIANACGARVFVSIHFNSLTDASVNYTKTFWGKRNKDEAFSQYVNGVVYGELADANGANPSNGGTWQFATGSLLHAEMPSTLVETVFLSNDAEAQRLSDPSGARLAQISQAIADAVTGWLATH